jgi:DNA-binding XRE family transcriptional regulator
MTPSALISADEVLTAQLGDPEFRADWERTAPARAVALRLIAYRIDHALSQTQLGRLLGMAQPAIARLESGEHTPNFETLLRIVEALDQENLGSAARTRVDE